MAEVQPLSEAVLYPHEDPCLTKWASPYSFSLCLSLSPSPCISLQFYCHPSHPLRHHHVGTRSVSSFPDEEDILLGDKLPGSSLVGTQPVQQSVRSFPASLLCPHPPWLQKGKTSHHQLCAAHYATVGAIPASCWSSSYVTSAGRRIVPPSLSLWGHICLNFLQQWFKS